jgi:hypothetical protein
MEELNGGVVQTTTVANDGKSVHSRHTIIGGEMKPSQYYGECVRRWSWAEIFLLECQGAEAAPQRDGMEISNASDTKSNVPSIQVRQPDFPQPARITLAVLTALDDPFGDDLCEWVCTVGKTEFSQSALESRRHGLNCFIIQGGALQHPIDRHPAPPQSVDGQEATLPAI